jgi:SAM-dependent methyltransferase
MYKEYIHVKYDKCPVCESVEIEPYYNTRDRHYGIEGNYQIDVCKVCGLAFLNPMPTQEYLSSLYPQTYYAYQNFLKKDSIAKTIAKTFFVRVSTKDPHFEKVGKMLDVGCGSGEFIYKMREKGWQVNGVEINANAARVGVEAGKLDIFSGELQEANYVNESFDYIRLNHSFEHVVKADLLLQEAHRILKNDGKMLIGVPNKQSFNANFFKRYWWYLGAPVHTFNYTPKSLTLLLQNNGFRVEKINYNSDYSGILGSIQIYFNRNSGKVSTKGALYKNPFLKIIFHKIAKFLDLLKKGDAIEVIATKAL